LLVNLLETSRVLRSNGSWSLAAPPLQWICWPCSPQHFSKGACERQSQREEERIGVKPKGEAHMWFGFTFFF